MEVEGKGTSTGGRRPYRSHLHPACLSCRKRKSRCQSKGVSETCVMCQVHGTDCVFPSNGRNHRRVVTNTHRRETSARTRQSYPHRRRGTPLDPGISSLPQSISNQPLDYLANRTEADSLVNGPQPSAPSETLLQANGDKDSSLPKFMGMLAGSGDGNSHIVSPAVADDNDALENYLSTVPDARSKRLIRTTGGPDHPNRPVRPVLFSTVQRRPLGMATYQSPIATKCEIIEKLIEPHAQELVNLYFLKTNICFPMFDEASFQNIYANHKQKISPALLTSIYAATMVHWKSSQKLRHVRCPDTHYIFVQLEEALHSELLLSPGISTVLAVILNIITRPSTSIFSNGGLIGVAVALSNTLGLNRDPSKWDITPFEKRFRIRIWWLLVIHECWCSLAYGTPLQIHRAQHDVPVPKVEDICEPDASPSQVTAASIFIALVTLTKVLGRYLEYFYHVSKDSSYPPDMTPVDLELLLSEWEDSLSGDIRRIALRGVHLDAPGAANFRLGYLGVRLLLRRIQLDIDKSNLQPDDFSSSHYHMHAQRAAEDIVHLVQELNESHIHGFWIPVNAYSLTSATIYLLRSALRSENSDRNAPLKLAKVMISTLRSHRQIYGWDLADNCLANCGDMAEKIESGNTAPPSIFTDHEEYMSMDLPILDELFPGFGNPLEMDIQLPE